MHILVLIWFALFACSDAGPYSLRQAQFALADAGIIPPVLDTTGLTCTDDALEALVQPDRGTPDIFGHDRLVVDIPTGSKLRLCRTLFIDDPVRVRFNGARVFNTKEDGLVDMIKVNSTARGTSLEDVRLLYTVASPSLFDHDKTAITIKAPYAELHGVTISGTGWGVNLEAEAGQNVNLAYFENVVVRSCRRGGVKVNGVDASSGIFLGVRVVSCENHYQATNGAGPAIGIFDGSANSSLWLGAHSEVADIVIKTQPVGGLAPSTWINTYTEAFNPTNNGNRIEWDGVRHLPVGGHLALRDEVTGDRIGGGRSRLTFSAGGYFAQIPTSNGVMAFRTSAGGAASEWRLKQQTAPSGYSRWGFEHYFNQTKPTVSFEAQTSWGTVRPILGGQQLCDAVNACSE